MHISTPSRALVAAIAAAAVSGCVYAPSFSEEEPFDSGPFVFSDRIEPALDEIVELQLTQSDRQVFSVEVFDWNVDDTLTYVWELREGPSVIRRDTGQLGAPDVVDEVGRFTVPAFTVDPCVVGLRDNDDPFVRLQIFDEIPPDQVFDARTTRYTLTLFWSLDPQGTCPIP